MNHWLSSLLLTVTLISAIAYSQQQLTITLEQAEQRAIESSKLLRIGTARIEQAKLRTSEITTTKLPSLTFQAGYTHLSPVPPFQFTPPFPGAEPVTIAPVILDQTQLRLQLQQVLFAGNRISASQEAATFQEFAAVDDYRADELKIRSTVRLLYWNLYKLRETLRAFQQTLRQLEARVRDAENLFKAGTITSNDVLKLRVQLSNSRAQALDLESQESSLMVQLNNLLNAPINTRFELATVPSIDDTIETNIEALIAEGVQNRPDLSASKARIRAAEASVTVATAAWMPTVSLSAGYLYANPNQRILPNRARFDGTWDVGINLSWNMWNWLQPQYQVGQARAQYEQARYTAELLQDNAQVEIVQNYVALRPARERISVAKEAVLQAEENYSAISSRFTAGLATSTDVLEAEALLLQARTNLANAEADYMLAKSRLLNSLGK
ncbi:MAG: TolC family protein [Chlorobi bacterium]|nr:TolC family protein [Chlorobiota bacterium]